jgi:hypothetical protein
MAAAYSPPHGNTEGVADARSKSAFSALSPRLFCVHGTNKRSTRIGRFIPHRRTTARATVDTHKNADAVMSSGAVKRPVEGARVHHTADPRAGSCDFQFHRELPRPRAFETSRKPRACKTPRPRARKTPRPRARKTPGPRARKTARPRACHSTRPRACVTQLVSKGMLNSLAFQAVSKLTS